MSSRLVGLIQDLFSPAPQELTLKHSPILALYGRK